MPRYKLQIEYDGTPYKGWQAQDGLPTVQQAIQTAMAEFVRHPVTVFAAGRTDAGVHGLGQIIHVDLEAEWPLFKILEATNGLLRLKNHPISVIKAEHAEPDFDARFSAVKRHYRYRIINRPANLT
ncbi:MAG: tRNA pseudouridine synthase A, partial [Salaquimonas sp.]